MYSSRTIGPNGATNDDFINVGKAELYLTSLYFVTTTMTTVGYGEISQVNVYERILGILILAVGSVAFSFCAASVTSILSSND